MLSLVEWGFGVVFGVYFWLVTVKVTVVRLRGGGLASPATAWTALPSMSPNAFDGARSDAWRGRIIPMSRNPFVYDRDAGQRGRDESSEFGFGPGMFPNPTIDFSKGGAASRIPIADPDSDAQLLELAMIKRTDVGDPTDVPSPYTPGNADRYGAAPPLVREQRMPPDTPRPRYTRPRMERQW